MYQDIKIFFSCDGVTVENEDYSVDIGITEDSDIDEICSLIGVAIRALMRFDNAQA